MWNKAVRVKVKPSPPMTLVVQMDEATLPNRTERHTRCRICVLLALGLPCQQTHRKRNCPSEESGLVALYLHQDQH
jgi:hypothetical protein